MSALHTSLILIIVFFVAHTVVIGQDNFLPGYVVNMEGDTLQGDIHFADWDKNPKVIRFRNTSNSEVYNFTANNIKSFGVSDVVYRSAIVEIEISPIRLQELDHDPTYKFRKDTVFLKMLVTGEKELAIFIEAMGKTQLYTREGSGYQLLLFKEYLKEVDGLNQKAENSKYKGQLILYLSDCQSITDIVKDAQYTENSIARVFQHYADCTGEELHVDKPETKTQTNWSLFAGISNTSLILEGAMHPELSSMNFDKSTNSTFGVGLNFRFKGNQGKWSLQNELMTSFYSLEGHYKKEINPNEYFVYNADISFTYLKINNLARFSYPAGPIRIFVNGGISSGFMLSETIDAAKSSNFYSNSTNSPIEVFEDIRKFEFGLLMGGGLGFHQFDLEFRFDRGNGFSKITSLKSKTKRLFIILSYNF
ncbi:MAG: PorT family protein [Bacteroidetes bacterium]|nr:PorT family protein [Bacteroidota bacterium]